MIALIKLETQLMKTAKPSAKRVKLIPNANCLEIKIGWPESTTGISFNEIKNEDKINIKESKFLSRADILPAKGNKNAPITGIKILLKIRQS